jgi:superfamily II DNA or RNA helicase
MKTDIILRDYQHESLRFLETDFEKLVLAMCPSSGKTETVIYYIDQLIKQNKNLKVLILPHSTNVLLNNFYDRLGERNVGFTYSTDTSVDCNVHTLLPQSKSKIKDEYDLLIVDEAHENYFAKTVQNIIIKTKPKKQILLTGTPYQFIGKDDFKIHFLALNELDKNTIPKLRVDIIESNYQWNGNYNSVGEVKKQFDFNDNDTKITLDKTFKFLLKRGNKKKKSISKTLIICNNIKQSECVKSYLDNIGLSSVVSNSKNDTKSELVQDFKRNKINILIVVNRARLGYDDIDLINLIDMSGTLNPNLIYQMIARVLRGSNDIQKYYTRLTSKKDESLNSEIVTNLALMLTDKKYISAFNGKNFKNQAVIVPNCRSRKYIINNSNFAQNSPKLLVDTDDMISFYRDAISDIDKGNGVYKFCKIEDVLIELGIRIKYTLELCKKISSKYKTKLDWIKSEDYASYLYASRNNYIDECCENMDLFYKKHTLESCIQSASKYKTRSEWFKGDRKSYTYAKNNKIFEECCKNMSILLKKHTLESCMKIASKYKSQSEWRIKDSKSYGFACRNKILKQCCENMIALRVKHTLDSCVKSASKYKTKGEWLKHDYNVYKHAQRNSYLEDCFKHFKK